MIIFIIVGLPFNNGEKLIYDVSYGPLYAGLMEMSVKDTVYNGIDCFKFSSVLSSNKDLSWLFKVHDTIFSIVGKKSFKPYKVEKHIHETNYRQISSYFFDYKNELIVYSDTVRYPLPDNVHDIVSINYYFRTVKLKDSFNITVHADEETEFLRVLTRKNVKIKVGKKTYKTVEFKPNVKGKGKFGKAGSLIVYLTQDSLRIPVLIKTRMFIGFLEARLKFIKHE